MNWIKYNWGWVTVIIIGLLPLTAILKMINIDFTGSAESWITMDSFTLQGRRPGELPREVSGAHMAVKETGEWAIRWIVIILSLTPFSILTGKKTIVIGQTGSRNHGVYLCRIALPILLY